MNPSCLELRFKPDTDATGELSAAVRHKDFAGSGSAWFHFGELEAFSHLLQTTFPIPSETQIRLEGGYWRNGANPPELLDVLLGLKVYPVGTTGSVGVHVEVMEGSFEGQRRESRARLLVELLTDYESIRAFGQSTAQLLTRPGITARLVADAA